MAADISSTSGMRAHSALRPSSDGGPGSVIGLRASARRTSMRSMIDSAPGKRRMRLGHSSGGGHVRALGPLAARLDVPAAEGGVDREDLAVADVADGAGLGDAVALRPRS